MNRPAWLLALAFAVCVSGLVFLEYAERPVANLMAMAVPVLAALFVAARVEARSDLQDEKLEQHTATLKDQDESLATITHATNGGLTERLEAFAAPIHARLDDLHAVVLRHHPDDPLITGITTTPPEEK